MGKKLTLEEAYDKGFIDAVEMFRAGDCRYGIGNMLSQWTADEVADDILERAGYKKDEI